LETTGLAKERSRNSRRKRREKAIGIDGKRECERENV
jgi:hypothetical protein